MVLYKRVVVEMRVVQNRMVEIGCLCNGVAPKMLPKPQQYEKLSFCSAKLEEKNKRFT